MDRAGKAHYAVTMPDTICLYNGTVRPEYHSYSKLGKELYHCHLAYSWVAVWRNTNGSYVVKAEYVGSREKSLY